MRKRTFRLAPFSHSYGDLPGHGCSVWVPTKAALMMRPGQIEAIARTGSGALRARTLVLLLAPVLSVCPTLEAGEPVSPTKVDYTVRVENLSRGQLHVAMRVSGCKPGALLLHGVPFYAKNPTPQAIGEIVSHLRADNLCGRQLEFDTTRDPKGQPVYVVHGVQGDLNVEYDLLVRFGESPQTRQSPILLPFKDSERAWLYGNCIFLHPEVPVAVGESWPQPMEITVQFDLSERIPLVGVQAFRDRTFSHKQLVETIQRETRVDPTRFFATYVEGNEAPPEALVKENLRKAQKLGVFHKGL